ncbi:pyridoxamine 5'-phosphate oxidase family protein [Clostridium baratii]|uniref:pyridoxamine 5'-phosphate oxidase family protein n=1 Tax=Clostridium baratii TaxID=1561 RepID=UPI003D32C090
MLTEKFYDVINHEGIVSIGSCSNNEVHICNTWNSYLVIVEGNKILIPAAAMIKTEENVTINPKIKLTLGSKEVMGYMNMGTGFLLEGTAKFLKDGEYFDMMLKKYPFLTRVLEFTVESCKQTL